MINSFWLFYGWLLYGYRWLKKRKQGRCSSLTGKAQTKLAWPLNSQAEERSLLRRWKENHQQHGLEKYMKVGNIFIYLFIFLIMFSINKHLSTPAVDKTGSGPPSECAKDHWSICQSKVTLRLLNLHMMNKMRIKHLGRTESLLMKLCRKIYLLLLLKNRDFKWITRICKCACMCMLVGLEGLIFP